MNTNNQNLIARCMAAGIAMFCETGAMAEPIMSVNGSYVIANFDNDIVNVGDEIRCRYVVSNISHENINDNNLIEFIIPTGLNQGVLLRG